MYPIAERQSWDSEWCRLAYWELAQRVGRQFGVRGRAVDVFGGGGGACGAGRRGLCLDALTRPDAPPVAPGGPHGANTPAHLEQVVHAPG